MMAKLKRRFTLKRRLTGGFAYFIMALCGALTVYIFAASYETVFNRDLPVVEAINTVELQPVSRVLGNYRNVSQTDFGNYGRPQFLKLPSQDAKMVLGPVIEVNGGMLARANTAHLALTSSPKNGNIGSSVLYYRKSWRTNDKPEQTKVGDNIFIDTDRDWRYFYRVIAVKEASQNETYVAQDTPTSQLILVSVDGDTGKLYIAQASLVNVQNVRL